MGEMEEKNTGKRKTKDSATRPSDDQERQPKIWTAERDGTMKKGLASMKY